MKKLIIVAVALGLAACQQANKPAGTPDLTKTKIQSPEPGYAYYGDTINSVGAIAPNDLLTAMTGNDTVAVKLKAPILATCQMKGCWMNLDLGNGEQMHVTFKDYGFFVPKGGVDGKMAIVQGKAYVDTIQVDEAKHLAEDAGKSAAEIAAITQPKVELGFEATGVMIKD